MRNGRVILALFAVFLVTNAYVFPTVARRIGEAGGMASFHPLDLRVFYSPSDAHAALASLGNGGRRLYTLVELSIDVIYPVVYALFFFLLARWLLARTPPTPTWLERATLLPFVTMGLDLLENVIIVALIEQFPTPVDGLARFASVVTTTKLFCLALSVLLLLFIAGRWSVSRRRVHEPT